jgi:hypothetical protein
VKQSHLAKWLKVITVVAGLLGILFFFYFVPATGNGYAYMYPEFAYLLWPYLIWAWVTAVPCYIALVYFFKICCKISKGNSFCRANAKWLLWISRIILFDTVLFFTISVVFLFSNMLHPGFFIDAFLVDVGGLGVSIWSAVLSHLVNEGCNLKEAHGLTL